MIRIKLPSVLTLKRPMSGEVITPEIEMLREYINNMYIYGVTPITSGGVTTAELINDAERDFDIDHFGMLCSIPDVTVEFYSPYIKVQNLDVEVPIYMPNREYKVYNEEGELIEDRLKTWREWISNNYSITEHDGSYYFLSYAGTGKSLNFDILKRLLTDGISLVDKLPQIEEDV